MDKYAKAFVKSSLIFLGIGTIIGILMLLWPGYRFTLTRVHVHVLLLGFMAMMIYGVGYHILPRFMGRPVYSHRLGNVQVWLANITLIGLSFKVEGVPLRGSRLEERLAKRDLRPKDFASNLKR
jgi:cbb3-type cytochrome oxidase subunit 1